MKSIKLLISITIIFSILNINTVTADEYAGNYNALRIENEDKLVVPKEKTEEVWKYMVKKLVDNKSFLKSLDERFDSYYYDELFKDTYFDTPALQMLEKEGGVRHRIRWNLDDIDHEKSGRELIQIKISNIDGNKMNRGEIKFEINTRKKVKTIDDTHRLIRLIDKDQREDFKKRMSELEIDPYKLKEILKLEQLRHSIYITLDGEQFMSIRLDEVTSKKLLFFKFEHVEIEPELNEVPYTEATPEERERMEIISKKIVNDILDEFPDIQRDLTPKYNKAFNYFYNKIPFFKFLIKYNFI